MKGVCMSYSKWLKMDLHIHSHESKRTKNNDYDGEDLTFNKLLNALEKENVSVFSITDHNTINVSLYNELIEKKDYIIQKNMNFIIGAELDFYDSEVHESVFHMLTFFDTEDLSKLGQILANLYKRESNEKIDSNVEPIDLKSFFKEVFSNGISNVITIPHFNSKDKGIPSDGVDKFVYTVFNALEDSNNRNRLVKSISAFKKYNYTDVPVVVFSDNHNIDIYPSGKDKNVEKQTSIFILGNIKHPFASVKAAFQDINTRVSIYNSGTRNTEYKNKYIKSIELDDQVIEFSPYQNTIIGGFGTGKSFLLDLIVNGKDKVDQDKYSAVVSNYERFNILFSDGTNRSSLNEVKDEVKIVKFNQYKDIYFKNKLYDEERKLLESNLHIEFPNLEKVTEESTTDLINAFIELEKNIFDSSTKTDIVNYDAISRSAEKEYSYKDETISEIYIRPDYLNDLLSDIHEESNRKVLNFDFYKNGDKAKIENTEHLISSRNEELESISSKLNEIVIAINKNIIDRNEVVKSRNSAISSNLKIWDDIKDDVKNYMILLKNLKVEADLFDDNFSNEKYNAYKDYIETKDLHTYKLIAKYDASNEKPNISNEIFKQLNRQETFFKSILCTMNNNDTFAQSKTFEDRLNRYTKIFYGNFNKVCYDILDSSSSILKKSAGEKANVIINLIFNIIEEYSNSDISSIVILDQPEDNLDNRGIQNEVVERIRSMKCGNCLPQLICVTHNANISITADSENIILANKLNNKCYYQNSGIEDESFIDEVCKTVEGGSIALRKRGIKFNIPMIKDVEMEV